MAYGDDERGEGERFVEVGCLQSELSSLGIECKRRNEFNNREELEALANAIKEVYFQDYKTAYDDYYYYYYSDQREPLPEKKSHFMIWGRELVK